MDPADYRRESRRRWGMVARGWKARREFVGETSLPVSMRMIEAIEPQPGHRVLELAAGPGDVGFLAAELIQPGGELICTDFAPEMLTAAQERATELGLTNVRFKQVDAESIDLEAGSVDGVLCRWGYMLMADAETALRETRRVLRPGGRLALAAWTAPEENPWASVAGAELVRRGLFERPAPGEPGQFAWADRQTIVDNLQAVGFVDDIEVEPVDLAYAYPDFEAWWETTLDMAPSTADLVAGMPPAEREDFRSAIRAALEPHTRPDGRIELPGRSWVASASA
jgi:SAM-dependent methyltransferase